jgi:exosortase/archaeosortase family protein
MNRGDYLRIVVVFFVFYVILRYSFGLLLERPTAQLVSFLLGCNTDGNTIICGHNAYEIVPECTGIVSLALFYALLYVLKVRGRKLWRAVAFGTVFLYLLDVLRVYTLIRFTGSISAFDVAHTLSWFISPAIIVAYVLWLTN